MTPVRLPLLNRPLGTEGALEQPVLARLDRVPSPAGGNRWSAEEPGAEKQFGRVVLLSNHGRQCPSPSTVCDSSAMMRDRALVVRSIKCLASSRQEPHGGVCSQLAQEVVNASLRTPLHRSDNADVKLLGAFFAHSLRFTSRSRCPASRTGHTGGNNPSP